MKNAKAKSKTTSGAPCLCQGLGPALTECLRGLGPPGAACEHFGAARIEFLKGLRALLDARIEQIRKQPVKGERISVE